MKLAWTFLLTSALLLLSSLADAGDRDHRKDQNTYKQRDHKHKHHDARKHYHGKHHEKHRRDEHYAQHKAKSHRHNRHSDYVIGGRVVGAAINHAFHHSHSFCPDRRHGHRRSYRYGDLVWSDYTQSCYRVKRGRYGDVFKQVPRRRCF